MVTGPKDGHIPLRKTPDNLKTLDAVSLYRHLFSCSYLKMKYSKKFVNEIGNPIMFSSKITTDTATNKKTQKRFSFDAINMRLSGPTSVSENTVTIMEAKVMMQGLRKTLKNLKKSKTREITIQKRKTHKQKHS